MTQKNSHKKNFKAVTNKAVKTFDDIENRIGNTAKEFDSYVAPVRTSVLRRFPILFTLLTTFGVAATFLAFEKILTQYELLNRYPWLILLIGLSALAFTGSLYKKLDS